MSFPITSFRGFLPDVPSTTGETDRASCIIVKETAKEEPSCDEPIYEISGKRKLSEDYKSHTKKLKMDSSEDTPRKSMSFCELPREIRAHIANFLSPKETVAFMLVEKVVAASRTEILKGNGKCVAYYLERHWWNLNTLEKDNSKLYADLNTSQSAITELDIPSSIALGKLKAILQLFNQIKNISVPFLKKDEMPVDLFSENLESIDLSNSDIDDQYLQKLAQRCKRLLRDINISSCDNITDEGIKAIASKCTQLHTFDLSHNKQITTDVLKKVLISPHLQTLYLTHCDQITDEGLKEVAINCPQLLSLDLAGCLQLTDKGIKEIAASCSQLQMLALSCCDQITDDALNEIAMSCPQLRRLFLNFCDKITYQGVENILSKCHSLRFVSTEHALTRFDTQLLKDRYPHVTIV
jgi:hypothetical protein